MTHPLDPYTLRQAAARWPRETLNPRAAQSFLRSLWEDADEPAVDEWPPGTCEQCGHRWADHDERDGCGACALTFTRSCKGWPQ
jgi:ribosomal protein S27AE